MISHELNCIFIHIPKCGGTSIEAALGHFDAHTPGDPQDHRGLMEIQPFSLSTAASKRNIIADLRRLRHIYLKHHANPANRNSVNHHQYRYYFKFTFVRNPWSRAYSWYGNVMREPSIKKLYDIDGEMSFSQFLRRFAGRRALRPQVSWLRNKKKHVEFDFIGKFENLSADFEKVCRMLNTTTRTLPHFLSGRQGNYRQAYDSELVNIVGDIYREDIELFGYSFDT